MNWWTRIRARFLSWLRPPPGLPPQEPGPVVEDWLANLPVVETTLEVREVQPLPQELLPSVDDFSIEYGANLRHSLGDNFDPSWLDPLRSYWQERGVELPPFAVVPRLALGHERVAISMRGQPLRTFRFPGVDSLLSPDKGGWTSDESAPLRMLPSQALLLEASRSLHQDFKLWLGSQWVRDHCPDLDQKEVRELAATLRSLLESGHGLIPPEDWWLYRQRFRNLSETLIVPSACQPVKPLDPDSRLSHLLGALPADFVHSYSATLEPLLRELSFDSYDPALECRAIEDFLTLWRSPLSPPAAGLAEVCQAMAAQKPAECAFRWLLSRALGDPRDEFYRLAERSPEMLLEGLLRWSHQSPPRLPRFQETAILVQCLGKAAGSMRTILEDYLGQFPRVSEEKNWEIGTLREFYRRCGSLFATDYF